MHIQTLSLSRFKGLTGSWTLSPVTVLWGSEFTGKTGLADAIRVALAGYSPRHGKAASKTWGFAGSATRMSVAATFDDGTSITRQWNLSRVSVKTADPVIVGTSARFEIPPVMLDVREYLGKSGPEKIRYVFSMLPDKFDALELTARLKRDVKVATPSKESEEALAEACAHVEEFDRDSAPTDLQTDIVNRIVETFKEARDLAKANLARMASVVQGTASLESQAAPPANVEAQLNEARAKLKALSEELGKVRAQEDALNAAKNDRLAAEEVLKEIPDLSESIRVQEEICKREDENELEPLPLKQKQALATNRRIAEQYLTRWESFADEAKVQLELFKAQETPEILKTVALCPDCRANVKGFLVDQDKKRREELDAKFLKAKAEVRDAKKKLAETVKAYDEADAIDVAVYKARQSISDKRVKLANDQVAQARRQAYMQILAKPLPEVSGVSEDRSAEAEALEKKIAELNAKQKAFVAWTQDQLRKEQARAEHEKSSAEKEVYDLALKVVAEFQSDLAKKAFGGFLGVANKFTDGILRSPIEFKDEDLGYWRQSENGVDWCLLDYFSGTENLLAFAGLSVALAQKSPFKIVVLDEMGNMNALKKIVAERMVKLQREGVVNQVVMIDPRGADYAGIDGVAVVEVK